jgi:hypothetical protein
MKVTELNKICDPRGNLTFLENKNQIPFCIERIYWIYDVPGGNERSGHAFKSTTEFIVALSGSIEVKIKKNNKVSSYTLNSPNFGILLPPLTWREITNFSTNSVALVLASKVFRPEDYIRDYYKYQKLIYSQK